jgi:hypothetical protein
MKRWAGPQAEQTGDYVQVRHHSSSERSQDNRVFPGAQILPLSRVTGPDESAD